MKRKEKSTTAIGIAWYREEEYPRLLEVSENRDWMHSTFSEWKREATKMINIVKRSGQKVEKIDIHLEEVLAWCQQRGLPFNGQSRSLYASEMVRKKHQSGPKP